MSFVRLAIAVIATSMATTTAVASPPATDSTERVVERRRPSLQRLRGTITIDGSSTVYPITEAMAEEFKREARNVNITVGVSGTGGGFKRFAAGESDVSNASRPIKPSEAVACEAAGVEFMEIPVAYDGLTIAVHPTNDWVDRLTLEDLRIIYLSGGATTWREVRPEWPDLPIRIYAPGTDSGTFDYFRELVGGRNGTIRSDLSVSEDDNVLVRGVAGDPNAIGFFGAAYYFANRDKVRAVPIVNNAGKAVLPTAAAIENGSYNPFSRPLFIYVHARSSRKPHVRAFVEFYLQRAAEIAAEIGYVGLPVEIYDRVRTAFRNRRTGSNYLDESGEQVHGLLSERLR